MTGGQTVGVAVLAMASATSVQAQDFAYSDDATVNCLNSAEASGASMQRCIGQSAQACIDDNPGGSSTVGLGICYSEEAGFWDSALNVEYQRLLVEAEQFERANAKSGINAPDVIPSLRDMQRNWIAYRDMRCEFEAVQWGGGTGTGPATAQCHMTATAEQALYLRGQMLEIWE